MRNQRFPKKLLFLLLLPLSLLFTFLAAGHPLWVERIYSNTLYLVVQHIQSLLTGFIPFSVGEFIVVLMIFYLIFGISRAILQILAKALKDFTCWAAG